MKKRLFAVLLCVCLLVGLVPPAVLAVGTDTGKAIQLGTGGISGWDSADGYDYIYFGYWEIETDYTTPGPIKWRVLDDQTNTEETGLFMLSETLLIKDNWTSVYFQESQHSVYDGNSWTYYKGESHDGDHANCQIANAWQDSEAQEWCNDFYSGNLTMLEQGAVLATTKSDGAFTSSTYSATFAASDNILNGDKVFFLSAEEAETGAYGFTNDAARIAYLGSVVSNWWLRSPYTGKTAQLKTWYVGRFTADGVVINYQSNLLWPARPAFNLDQNAVLLTSAAVDGKASGTVGADALQAVAGYSGNEWKLTLLDASRKSFSVSGVSMQNGTVSFSYSGAQTGTDEYISAVVVDNGAVTYYGHVLQLDGTANGANGTASLSLPADVTLSANTKLYVFNEQYNGDQKTDYASDFVDITSIVIADGGKVELRTNETHIQWKYKSEGDDAWRDLLALSAIAGGDGSGGSDGADGREIELQNNGTTIQWRYKGDTTWNDLVDLSALTGAAGQDGKDGQDGADGREVELRVDGGYIQWRYTTGSDTEWKNLIAISALQGLKGDKGDKGDPGADGQDGKDGQDGLPPYIGDNGNWWIGTTDTGIKATSADGKDGSDGVNGKDGVDGTNGAPGKDGKNGVDGQDGKDGVGIANIEINDSGELIVTLTDGTEKNLGKVTGSDGVGIIGATINEDGERILTLSDGTELNAGVVRTEEAVAAMAPISEQNSGQSTLLHVFMGISGLSLAGLIALLIFLYTKRKVLFGK